MATHSSTLAWKIPWMEEPGRLQSMGSLRVGHDLETAAAAAAKLLQSCPTLRLHRWQPTRLCCPWESPGKNTGVGCHILLHCMKVKSESEVTSVMSDPSQPHGLQPTRLLHPWDPPGKSTGVGCHCLLHLHCW